MAIFRRTPYLAILLCLVSPSAVASRTAVHECDRVAAHPGDDERVSPGVQWRDLEPSATVTACREAIAAYPRTRRFHYQLGRGLLKAGQYEAAIEIFGPLADHGYAMAQYALGNLYAGGRGTPRDPETAVAWYRKAAQQGNAPAQNNIARMYLQGSGVKRDFRQAIEWFTKAAENGLAAAQTNLGNLFYVGRGVPRDYAEAAMWYRKAAELDYVQAQINLGLIYEHGRGVERNLAAAFELYLRAAARGSVVAQTNVGLMYMRGRGIAADDAQAVYWFRKAAAQNRAIAQSNLGLMYSRGRGVGRNDTTAAEWYHAAARQGYAVAQNNLGLMYAEGRGVSKDEVKAAEWIRRAAEQGNADAQYNLGILYSRGRGVPQDLAQSARWHFRAARQDVAAGRGLRLPSSSPEMRVAYSALAVVPALLLVWALARRGRDRALARALWRTAGLGVMVAMGATLIGLVVPNTIPGSNEAGSGDFAMAFLAAAAPEELGRFCVLYLYCLKRRVFSRPMDGLIYGVVASLGFSAFENAVYAYGGGVEAVILKSVTTTPLHVAFGAIMGGLLALARGSPKQRRMMVGLSLFLPILLHGLHNLVVLTAMGARDSTNGTQDTLIVASMAVILGLSLLVYWRLRKRDAA